MKRTISVLVFWGSSTVVMQGELQTHSCCWRLNKCSTWSCVYTLKMTWHLCCPSKAWAQPPFTLLEDINVRFCCCFADWKKFSTSFSYWAKVWQIGQNVSHPKQFCSLTAIQGGHIVEIHKNFSMDFCVYKSYWQSTTSLQTEDSFQESVASSCSLLSIGRCSENIYEKKLCLDFCSLLSKVTKTGRF